MIKHSRVSPKSLKLALVAVLAVAGVTTSGASMAADATAASSSTVVQPIVINKTSDLSFGKFAAGTGGTLTLSTSGARSVTAGVIAMSGGTNSAAKFDVTGETGATYTITLPASATLNKGGDSMTFTLVSDFTGANSTSGTVAGVGSGALTAGAQSFYVGGVLTVASLQPAGDYIGTVVASVEYN